MNEQRNNDFIIFLALVLAMILSFSLLACGGTTSTVTVTQTQTTTTPTQTTEELSLGKTLTLEPDTSKDSGAAPPYEITTKTPVLKGSDAPQVKTFNQSVSGLIDRQLTDFKQQVQAYGEPRATIASTLSIDYTLKSPPGQIVSLVITSDSYMSGGAHPGRAFQTVSYDLPNGKMIPLSQLFLPGADYLTALSTYCTQELTKRDALLFPEGATPAPDNYKNWTLTSSSVEVTFDEYQVAPYALGPQTVDVPYTYLQKIIDPKGPVGRVGK